MGFFDNYTKSNTERMAADLLQDITYNSRVSGDISISALLNVKQIPGEEYVQQQGNVGVFTDDVTPAPGDTFTDTDSRLWYVDNFIEQKGSMIFMFCYSNNEAKYK